MDVKEFLDSLFIMCKKGIKTKEFRESNMGKKMAQGHPKYETFDFDFYDIWYTYTKGDVNIYNRDPLSYGRFEGSKYESIEFKRWDAIFKYTLECYFKANNEMFSDSAELSQGWYVIPHKSGIKNFIERGAEFVIGYDGGLDSSYDFNFENNLLFWNLNHQQPWIDYRKKYYFKPSFNLPPVFMNWDETPWEVKE